MSIDFKTLTPEEMAICRANFLKPKVELERLILDYRSNIGKESKLPKIKVIKQPPASPIRRYITDLTEDFDNYFHVTNNKITSISKHEVLPSIEWLNSGENANIIAEINKLTDRASENDEFTVIQSTGLANDRYTKDWTDFRLIYNNTNFDFILEYVTVNAGMDLRVYINNTEENIVGVQRKAKRFIEKIAKEAGSTSLRRYQNYRSL